MVVTKCSPFEFHIFSASKRKKKKKAHTFKENPKTEKKKNRGRKKANTSVATVSREQGIDNGRTVDF